MSASTVYQTTKFEIVSLNDPDLEEVAESWGLDDIHKVIPKDSFSAMAEDNAYLMLNTANNGIGVIDPVNLSIYFNEYHPSEGMSGVRKTFIEEVLERTQALNDMEPNDDFIRGVNAVTDIFIQAQSAHGSKPATQDVEMHDGAV